MLFQRQNHCKAATLVHLAGYLDGTVHQVDDPFRDGKSPAVAPFIDQKASLTVKFFQRSVFVRSSRNAPVSRMETCKFLAPCDNEFGRKHTANRGEF